MFVEKTLNSIKRHKRAELMALYPCSQMGQLNIVKISISSKFNIGNQMQFHSRF
jgi:hypothetical protein